MGFLVLLVLLPASKNYIFSPLKRPALFLDTQTHTFVVPVTLVIWPEAG